MPRRRARHPALGRQLLPGPPDRGVRRSDADEATPAHRHRAPRYAPAQRPDLVARQPCRQPGIRPASRPLASTSLDAPPLRRSPHPGAAGVQPQPGVEAPRLGR